MGHSQAEDWPAKHQLNYLKLDTGPLKLVKYLFIFDVDGQRYQRLLFHLKNSSQDDGGRANFRTFHSPVYTTDFEHLVPM